MKMTRDALKALVKECLAEILVEGLGDAGSTITESVQRSSRQQTQFSAIADAAQKRQRMLRDRQANVKRDVNPNLKNAVMSAAGGDPMLQELLSHTAMTTLQKQNQAELLGASAPVGGVEMAIADVAPEQIFGEDNAEKWAQLAFMDNRPGLVGKKSS